MVTNTLSWEIPTPPPSNNLYCNVPGRGRVMKPRYKTWRADAGWEVRVAGLPLQPIFGPVKVELVIGDRRGDLDNRIKPVLDLMVDMRVIGDDCQVIEILASYGGADPRRSTVTVRPA